MFCRLKRKKKKNIILYKYTRPFQIVSYAMHLCYCSNEKKFLLFSHTQDYTWLNTDLREWTAKLEEAPISTYSCNMSNCRAVSSNLHTKRKYIRFVLSVHQSQKQNKVYTYLCNLFEFIIFFLKINVEVL